MRASSPAPGNPFDLDDDVAYAAWRARKLEDYPLDIGDLVVEVRNPRQLTATEFEAVHARCRKMNLAIVAGRTGDDPDKDIPRALGARFGLTDLDCNMGADDDGVTTLKVVGKEWRGSYIPYTNRPIHWHTDGYYNRRERQIRGLLLHCVSPAARGGENALLDHEIAYIHLRDANPEHIRALMQAEVMTIPPNVEQGIELRPARSGPVFSVLADGTLHMRYTARARNIEWSPHPQTQAAVAALNAFLASDSPYIYRATLQSGQCLVCNNVLHDRTGFDDDATHTRQLYRLRYYQRIAGT